MRVGSAPLCPNLSEPRRARTISDITQFKVFHPVLHVHIRAFPRDSLVAAVWPGPSQVAVLAKGGSSPGGKPNPYLATYIILGIPALVALPQWRSR